MKKTYMGIRLRRFREERGLTQVALARALELSPSYLNQLEQNQRPLSVPVLLKLNAVFGVDIQQFSEDDEARLIADLRDVFLSLPADNPVSDAEVRELAANMPAVARALIGLERNLRDERERAEALALHLGGDRSDIGSPTPMPYEEVRDFFYARHNHVDELDTLAEALFEACAGGGDLAAGLTQRLEATHGVRVVLERERAIQRDYDPAARVLRLSAHLERGQQAFQLATQLAFLEAGGLIDALAGAGRFALDESRALARIGLASYFAGALILPYGRFLDAAEALRYDIGLLERRFGVGFETVCHRLSTLQRPTARGVPFFFIRVDRAGNISKRQSATDFHFSRIGGTCPLWNVYEAFATPGRILTQLAAMPDVRRYLWVARTVSREAGAFGAPGKTFSIGLGCDLRHADRLVYSRGLDLSNPDAAIPIGAGCKVCNRQNCPQRAFPSMGRTLPIDANRRYFEPYRHDE
jgi:predicted transcriptional regulator/transcriptional regulator with XRE-family HTH domain